MPFYLADNAKGTLCSINIEDVPLMNCRIKKSFNLHIPRVSRNMLGFRIIIACDSKWEYSLWPAMLWHMLKVQNAASSTLWFFIDGAFVGYCFCRTNPFLFCIIGSLLSAILSFTGRPNNRQSTSRWKKAVRNRIAAGNSTFHLHSKPIHHCIVLPC